MDVNKNIGEEHIPAQVTGSQLDTVTQCSLTDEAAAITFFEVVKQRLLNVNQWSRLTGSEMAHFQLTNKSGNPLDRSVEQGDYIKINIPGPGTDTGDGYDWVWVESITEEQKAEMEVISLTVRPSCNPVSGNDDTAHFLTEKATSTFQVKRIGRHIYAEEHGRNEQANTHTSNTMDNVRNRVVGWAAKIGFSYPQWKSLIKGLISNP